jgi:hypothetical protein
MTLGRNRSADQHTGPVARFSNRERTITEIKQSRARTYILSEREGMRKKVGGGSETLHLGGGGGQETTPPVLKIPGARSRFGQSAEANVLRQNRSLMQCGLQFQEVLTTICYNFRSQRRAKGSWARREVTPDRATRSTPHGSHSQEQDASVLKCDA